MRAIGRELGLAGAELLDRHPFSRAQAWPFAACAGLSLVIPEYDSVGWVFFLCGPFSVGRAILDTYRAVLAIDDFPATAEEAAQLVNQPRICSEGKATGWW